MLVCVRKYTHSTWHCHAGRHTYQYEPRSTDKQLIKSLLMTCSHDNKKPKYFGEIKWWNISFWEQFTWQSFTKNVTSHYCIVKHTLPNLNDWEESKTGGLGHSCSSRTKKFFPHSKRKSFSFRTLLYRYLSLGSDSTWDLSISNNIWLRDEALDAYKQHLATTPHNWQHYCPYT